jgi:hypothetical protein
MIGYGLGHIVEVVNFELGSGHWKNQPNEGGCELNLTNGP